MIATDDTARSWSAGAWTISLVVLDYADRPDRAGAWWVVKFHGFVWTTTRDVTEAVMSLPRPVRAEILLKINPEGSTNHE